MTLSDLQAALERLGPDISGWPADLAEQTLDLMSVSSAAKDLFAAATLTALDGDRAPRLRPSAQNQAAERAVRSNPTDSLRF